MHQLLWNKPNSRKMVFSINEVGSFEVHLKVWIFKLLCIVDHTSKIESVPHNLFYKCIKLQKFCILGSICLKGLNRATPTQFQTWWSSFRLTLISLWNFITSPILRDGVSVSNGWKFNISSLIWNTSWPFWCSGVIATVGQI
jgi:hypothetical protein